MLGVYQSASTGVVFWIFVGIVGLVAGFQILLTVAVFFTALFIGEQAHAGEPAAEGQLSRPRPPAVDDAIAMGFTLEHIGVRKEGPFVTQLWLLLSADGRMMASIYQSSLGISRSCQSKVEGGGWISTTSTIALDEPRVTSIQRECFFDANMRDLIEYHRYRLARLGVPVVILRPDKVAQTGSEYAAAMVGERVAAGQMRWKDVTMTAAVATFGGALKQAASSFKAMSQASTVKKRADQIRQEMLSATSSAPVAQVPASSASLRVLIRTLADGQVSYMEYSQGGQTYLPVFSDQRTAESYSASLPPAPGEQRRIEAVDAAWLLACTARGYQPVLDAHLAERRLITETELRGVVPVPTNV